MEPKAPRPHIRRILVAMDTSTHGRAALKAAAELAGLLNAELRGLFVEDANLLRLAGLPFSQEFLHATRMTRALDSLRLERELRAQAEQLRRAMAQAVAETRVSWSFQVTRGEVVNEVLAAAEEADLLMLGKFGQAVAVRSSAGLTARTLAVRTRASVCLVEPGAELRHPIAVLYDGGAHARAALETAAGLALRDSGKLLALIAPREGVDPRELQRTVQKHLGSSRVDVDYIFLEGDAGRNPTPGDVAAIEQALEHQGRGILVLPADSPLCAPEHLEESLRRLGRLIVLAR